MIRKRISISALTTLVVTLALISLAGIGCSDSSNPVASTDSAPLLSRLVDNRDPEPRYEVVFTGTVERVDFDARVIYFLKTDFDVIVPKGAELYLIPTKRLIPFTEKYVYPGAEITVKGHYKGTETLVAETLEVVDEVITGQTYSNSL